MGSIWDQFWRHFATWLARVFDIISNDVKCHKKHQNRPQKHLFSTSFLEIFARWAHMRFWTTLHQKSSIFEIRGHPKRAKKRVHNGTTKKAAKYAQQTPKSDLWGHPLGTLLDTKGDAKTIPENDTKKHYFYEPVLAWEREARSNWRSFKACWRVSDRALT